MRKVYVKVETRLIIELDEGVDVNEVLQEMDYSFTPNETHAGKVDFVDTEIRDWEIEDSK